MGRQRRRRRAALIAVLCFAAISIKSILKSEDTFIDNEYELDTKSMDNNLHRILSYTASNGDTILHPNQVAELQQHQQQDTSPTNIPYPQLIATKTIPPYHLKDALQIAQLYDHTYLLLVYEPNSDTFYGLYHKWTSGNHKLFNSFNDITYMLRKAFPTRFIKGESDELVIPISSGDFPSIKSVCLKHFKRQEADNDVSTATTSLSSQITNTCSNSKAPILNFGSVFSEESIIPNMIAMPMPEPHHLPCFRMWADKHQICDELQPKQVVERRRNTGELYKGRGQSHYQMVYGKEYGIEWDELIPQIVWRGTDFSYLSRHNSLRKIQFNDEVFTSKEAAVYSLMSEESYNTLLPRWKAAVLTAEAEVNTKSDDEIPWANMKFSSYINRGSKTRTQGSKQYKKWEDIDMATGEYLGSEQLLHYKYHIDLGGGGGTTWSGTIIKLALPGLLFHHVTPAKDYIHDYMKPMVHYVPIKEDLSDLKEKFEWAESHPDEAKKISDEATKLMRYLTSEEGFREMYQQRIVEPLKQVINAYQPLSVAHFPTTHAERLRTPNKSTSWKDVKKAIAQIEGEGTLRPVIECAHSINACITTGVRSTDPNSTLEYNPFSNNTRV